MSLKVLPITVRLGRRRRRRRGRRRRRKKGEASPHSPYSPNIPPYEFHHFGLLNDVLRGHHVANDKKLKLSMCEEL